ncbi:hypothetical protein PSTG_05557 [Puccinia striiformis f. sp. tritici PST-78]|uniref:Calcium/proton exchanger n=1 Tax=Puccinia striiformis f. sp. tritici PST-78 TaxID=1165861 RepID=A0A0L0VPK7_9BASI|nr:hypothetical protein PSTG_05557 [Puccinia striiformis f. sp. tritici PST-78]
MSAKQEPSSPRTPTNNNNNNNNKGKAKATITKIPSKIIDSSSKNKRTLGADTFIEPNHRISSVSLSQDNQSGIPVPVSTTNNQAQPPPPASIAQPKSVVHEDEEDDEVQPIDRGEALVRRRMKERQRIKKEAERRLRRVADDEPPPSTRPPNTHTRPTTSRTRTAPINSHQHQPLVTGGTHRDPRLTSPSFESLWNPAAQQQTTTGNQSPETRSIIRLDIDSTSNTTSPPPPLRSVSPPRLPQSSYQSFGSPSQFSAPNIKSSISEQPRQLPLNLPPSSHHHQQIPANSVKSSYSVLHGKQQPGDFSTTDFNPRRLHEEYEEGQEVTDDEDQGTNDGHEDGRLYDISTPTARGRAGIPRTLSVRSSHSNAAHSLHRQSSRFSVAQSKSGEHHHRGESQSLLSNNEHDEILSHHSSIHTTQNPSHDDNDDDHNDGEQGSSSSSSPLDDEDVEYTLKDRQDAINIEHPFGLPIWKPALYKKSRSVARNAEAALHNSPTSRSGSTLTFGNLLWSLIFGIWLALVVAIVAAILFVIPWGGSKYGRVVWELAGYLVWPFGKYVEEWSEEEEEEGSDHQADDRANPMDSDRFGSGRFGTIGAGGGGGGGGGASRWVTVSEIDEDETASIDRLTIRGEDERRPLAPERPTPDYGGTTSPVGPTNLSPSKDRHPSDSTIKSDLTTMLGMFKRSGEGPEGMMIAKRQIRVRALGRLSFWVAYYLIIAPLMLTACLLCWFFVVTIPMAKLLWVLVQHVGTEPLALHFRSPPTYIDLHQVELGSASHHQSQQQQAQTDEQPNQTQPEQQHYRRVSNRLPPQLKPGQPAPKHSKKSLSESRAKGRLVSGKAKVLLCTSKALGLQYYKYTVDGVNIMFIILIPFVIFVILDFFFLAPLKINGGFLGFISSQIVLFVMALLSVIPLSYFIGMAVASISAQSSIGMGAVINATFGSIIEIILYGIALTEGKGELVEGSIIGSVLAGVLLLPGLSMIGGSFKRKEQRFNARSAGVTSTMLIMAIIGTLTPTLFYEIYGTFQLTCSGCPEDLTNSLLTQDQIWKCKSCRYEHLSPVNDSFYQSSVKGLSYYCACLLVLSYLIGLWFSLRTHASQIWQTPASVLPHGATGAAGGGGGQGQGYGGGGVMQSTGGMMPSMSGGEHHHHHHDHEFQHLTSQQRMSMYVRKLPEIVKQQLLPHLQRSISTHRHPTDPRSNTSTGPPTKATDHNEASIGISGGNSYSSGLVDQQQQLDDRMPRTLTTEEVNQTLHVLQMASNAFPTTNPRESGTNSTMLPRSSSGRSRPTSQIQNPHSRNPSRPQSHRQTGPHQSINQPTSTHHHHHHHHHPLTLPSALPIVPGATTVLVEEDHESGGHDAPNWSRTKSTTVLLLCTALYAIIAEILVSVVDVVLDGSTKLPEKFLGISLFALVPNTTEFMNAISFAINGNIALSMEIGSAYALQVCLIQIPAMIAISSIYNSDKHISASHTFTLVFPRWDVISIIFSVFLLTYTYIEARSNYHRGTILVLSYLVLIGGFYSAPVEGQLGALSSTTRSVPIMSSPTASFDHFYSVSAWNRMRSLIGL